MMKPVLRITGENACPSTGRAVIDPPKALWNGSMLLATLFFAIPLFSWSALALFLLTTYLSLLIGHDVLP